MSVLEAEGMYGGYGGADILNGASISVDAGEIVVIIGPNGAGKSTAMKAIFGLVRVRRGDVRLNGAAITNMRADQIVQRGMCYVPQEHNVFPLMTVHENLEMGAYLRDDDYSEQLDKVYELFPDMKAKRRALAGSLSGGQRQMVAVARALMMEPRILLLDEPTAGLSPVVMDAMFEKIQEVNRLGIGILMVEQNAKKALSIAHKGYVLVLGANRFEDTGPALLANPEVAEMFLGGRPAEAGTEAGEQP